MGRKAESYLRFRGYKVGQAFAGFTDNPGYGDAREVADHVMDLYGEGQVDRVELVYTRFVSAGNQEVVSAAPRAPGAPSSSPRRPARAAHVGRPSADYEYEPDAHHHPRHLVPRYVEARIYAALLERGRRRSTPPASGP